MKINSVDQRAHEAWAKLKAAEEKRKAELRKGNQVTCKATKARQKAQANVQPSIQPQKQQRYMQAGSSKSQGKRPLDKVSSESEDLPSDAYVINNASRTQEADAEQRGFLSWRMQDAEGILLLSSVIKYLCARTVS